MNDTTKIADAFASLKPALNEMMKAFESLAVTLPLNAKIILHSIIRGLFAEEVEVKFLGESIKIISRNPLPPENFVVLQSFFSDFSISWNQYMTCVIYTLQPKNIMEE